MTVEQMALSSPITRTISTHDFAVSQSSVKCTGWTQSQPTVNLRSYLLTQESQDRLILAPSSEASGTSYKVKLHYQNGSIFRKSHMTIAKEEDRRSKSVVSTKSRYIRPRGSIISADKEHGKDKFAVVEIGMHETDIKIVYRGKGYSQILHLSDPSTQTYTCTIDEQKHRWRPLGPSRAVLELVRGGEEDRVALFLYAEDNLPGSDASVQRRLSLGMRHDIGQLYTRVDIAEETRVHEEVLCSALAVVESRKMI